MSINNHIAFVFPGQGSQSVGMLQDLAVNFPEIPQTFAVASERLGYDLWELTLQGPQERLDETVHTQPALLAASVSLWRVFQKHQPKPLCPQFLAGHSLGEYSALVCAQALDFSDAIELVAERGRLMQQAVPPGTGAMAALVGLDAKTVDELCRSAAQGEVVAPANFNSLEQVVVSGHQNAVLRAVALAKQQGIKLAKVLPVSVPSHCVLMEGAALQFAKKLNQIAIKTPQIPVIHNVNVQTLTHPDDIRKALVSQLCQPVRWVEIIQRMHENGISVIYECGPGRVLSGLIQRINADIKVVRLNEIAALTAI